MTRIRCIHAVFVVVLSTFCLNNSLGQDSKNGLTMLPDDDNGRRFGDFVKAVCEFDSDQWMEFVQNNMSEQLRTRFKRETWLDQQKQMRAIFNATRFHCVGSCERSRVSLIGLRNNDPMEQWIEYFVEFDKQTPAKITNYSVVICAPPDKVLEMPLTEKQTIEELDRFVTGLIKEDLFSGTILLANKERVLFQKAAGNASLMYNVSNTLDTRFCLGSITKLFTATAIMQLVEQDQLSLDDPIGKYLDEKWVSEAVGKKVQVKHLLTHSGGVGDFFRHPDYPKTARSHFDSVNAFSDFIDVKQTEFEPGSKHVYSNSGFILLGAIIESVTGKDYHKFMDETIYQPNGMISTGCFFTNDPTQKLAQGYYLDRSTEKWTNNIFMQRVRGCPAGSSYSTVADMHRFSQRLLKGNIITNETVKLMIGPKPELGSPNYGYGVEQFRPLHSVTSIGHTGGGPGVACCFVIFPSTGHVLVILTNQHQRTMFALRNKTTELVVRNTVREFK